MPENQQPCPGVWGGVPEGRRIFGQVREVLAAQNSTSGGSSDRSTNVWQRTRWAPPLLVVVPSATPVTKLPNTRRNAVSSAVKATRRPVTRSAIRP